MIAFSVDEIEMLAETILHFSMARWRGEKGLGGRASTNGSWEYLTANGSQATGKYTVYNLFISASELPSKHVS